MADPDTYERAVAVVRRHLEDPEGIVEVGERAIRVVEMLDAAGALAGGPSRWPLTVCPVSYCAARPAAPCREPAPDDIREEFGADWVTARRPHDGRRLADGQCAHDIIGSY